ncbi:MAG: 3-keto-5-aminohexanoate cleavage protein [Burkholderiales bacterium]|nr:3-keto-5-aminohexanoate cleavage protein [Burkholderiales bacterium]
MTRDVIITCALTGAGDTTKLSSAVPITPEAIANEAIAARAAGASIVHIHVRDPETGAPSMRFEHYREVVERIRDAGSDVIINLTTGAGARFTPSAEDPRQATRESTITHPEARVEHVLRLKPEICSLDVATMNFGSHAFLNVPAHIERMAALVQDAGAKPELEVFDLGHVRLARHLCEQGVIRGTPLFQLCLGVPWGAPATPETMLLMRDQLPPNAVWAGFGIARNQFPMVAQAALLGGHVRVGLEDNLYLAKDQLAPGNAALVERAVAIIGSVGLVVATPRSARALLEL